MRDFIPRGKPDILPYYLFKVMSANIRNFTWPRVLSQSERDIPKKNNDLRCRQRVASMPHLVLIEGSRCLQRIRSANSSKKPK